MRAITITPDHSLRIGRRAEPAIRAGDDVKLQVLRVGICGTDRDEVSDAPIRVAPGHDDLVIGHEMVARVVEIGAAVRNVRPGDFAVLTVRRGCDRCLPCALGRADMCRTGDYRERGILGLDGYQTEMVVEKSRNVVHVPDLLGADGVLTEPLSIIEKAIHELERVQSARLPDAGATPAWLSARRCLVAGLGPVGLLAALSLRLKGAQVYGLDIVEPQSARPRWLEEIGGVYVDGREIQANSIDETIGGMDVIVEATGAPQLAFGLIDALERNGAYVLTGLPAGHAPTTLPGADLMRDLVLRNALLFGSVNAAYDHFLMAVHDLTDAARRWPGSLERLITHKYDVAEFEKPLRAHERDEIKAVIEWSA